MEPLRHLDRDTRRARLLAASTVAGSSPAIGIAVTSFDNFAAATDRGSVSLPTVRKIPPPDHEAPGSA